MTIAAEVPVYVGTYAPQEGAGIYLLRMNTSSGSLRLAAEQSGLANPSFLVIHPNRRFLYAVSEVGDFAGQIGGGVNAFAIDSRSGELTRLNERSTQGAAPCYVSIDRSGRYLLVANYGGGSVAVFPINVDGSLDRLSDLVQHSGTGPNPERQEGPHAHSAVPHPQADLVFVCDLGLDQVAIYQLDVDRGKLQPHHVPHVNMAPGAGPRHLVFDTEARHAYVINELDSTISVLKVSTEDEALRMIQVVSTLPAGFVGENTASDIHLHPSGKFLYGANRGHNSIAIYAVDQRSGRLSLVGHQSTLGKWPRNFAIDPSGSFLLVANQHSDSVVGFRINQETGQLTSTGQVMAIPNPVCLKFSDT